MCCKYPTSDIPFLCALLLHLTPDSWSLPLAIHHSSPSAPAPLPGSCNSPHNHMTDRDAGRWNSVINLRTNIHRDTHTHTLSHRQKQASTHSGSRKTSIKNTYRQRGGDNNRLRLCLDLVATLSLAFWLLRKCLYAVCLVGKESLLCFGWCLS